MNFVEDCLNKVKKDCYKFIKTQETSSDKFKNKDNMLNTIKSAGFADAYFVSN